MAVTQSRYRLIMKKTELMQEVTQLSAEELRNALGETRRALFGLRLNAATTHLKDYSQYKKLRKQIARILTVVGSK